MYLLIHISYNLYQNQRSTGRKKSIDNTQILSLFKSYLYELVVFFFGFSPILIDFWENRILCDSQQIFFSRKVFLGKLIRSNHIIWRLIGQLINTNSVTCPTRMTFFHSSTERMKEKICDNKIEHLNMNNQLSPMKVHSIVSFFCFAHFYYWP